MATWEYLVEKIDTEYVGDENANPVISSRGSSVISRTLTDLGDEGWELVSFLPASPMEYCTNYARNGYPKASTYYAVFKRPEDEHDAHIRRLFKKRGPGKLPA